MGKFKEIDIDRKNKLNDESIDMLQEINTMLKEFKLTDLKDIECKELNLLISKVWLFLNNKN